MAPQERLVHVPDICEHRIQLNQHSRWFIEVDKNKRMCCQTYDFGHGLELDQGAQKRWGKPECCAEVFQHHEQLENGAFIFIDTFLGSCRLWEQYGQCLIEFLILNAILCV